MQSLDGRACAAADAHLRQPLRTSCLTNTTVVHVCGLPFADRRTARQIFGRFEKAQDTTQQFL